MPENRIPLVKLMLMKLLPGKKPGLNDIPRIACGIFLAALVFLLFGAFYILLWGGTLALMCLLLTLVLGGLWTLAGGIAGGGASVIIVGLLMLGAGACLMPFYKPVIRWSVGIGKAVLLKIRQKLETIP